MEAQEKCSDSLFKVLSCGDFKLPSLLQASVNKIVEREGYITHKILNRSISTSGGNYLAELFEVDIKGQTVEGEKETNIFIKNKLDDAVSIIDINEAYCTETFFYAELSKLYDDFQNKANIPMEERYYMVKSYDASNPDAIILDNLAKKGFTSIHRMDVVPLKFAELSVQQLARFHGLSFVLEKRHPQYFAKRIKTMHVLFKFNDDYQQFYLNMTEHFKKYVDKDAQDKLDKYMADAVHKLEAYYTEKKNAGVTCTLCHGDYRANNILVKKQGDEVAEVIPVDYQLLYYGCPVMDLIYFIFPCTDQKFRRDHLNDLKNLYYDSLTRFLRYFDMDTETVYPREEFEAVYKERLDFGLLMSILLTPILFTDDNDIPDFTKDQVSNVIVMPNPKMGPRAVGLIDDFLEWGFL